MKNYHHFDGDRCFCPKTKKWKINGVHTSGNSCDQCGELLNEKKKSPINKEAVKAVSDHCHAG